MGAADANRARRRPAAGRRWLVLCGLVGCAASPGQSVGKNDGSDPVPAVPRWVNYCCVSGPPGRDCRVVPKREFRACGGTEGFAMQCKRKLCNAAVPGDACWCCREEPGGTCVTRIHTPTLTPAEVPPPKKPKPPEAERPATGTVWSPY